MWSRSVIFALLLLALVVLLGTPQHDQTVHILPVGTSKILAGKPRRTAIIKNGRRLHLNFKDAKLVAVKRRVRTKQAAANSAEYRTSKARLTAGQLVSINAEGKLSAAVEGGKIKIEHLTRGPDGKIYIVTLEDIQVGPGDLRS